MRRILLLIACAYASGCTAAYTEHVLQRESARVITPTPNPDSVKISVFQRDRLGNASRWVLTTSSGVYDCSKEQGEQLPICVKRGGPR